VDDHLLPASEEPQESVRVGAGQIPRVHPAAREDLRAVTARNVRAYITLREGAERPAAADLIRFCRERIGYGAPERRSSSSTRCRSTRRARSTASASNGWPKTTST
jgi:hypothetical protein